MQPFSRLAFFFEDWFYELSIFSPFLCCFAHQSHFCSPFSTCFMTYFLTKNHSSKALTRMEQLGPCSLLASFCNLRLKLGTLICISSSENLNLTNNESERNENCLSKLTKTTYKYFEKILKLHTRQFSQWIQNGHKNKKKLESRLLYKFISCSLAHPFSKKQTGKQTIL